MPTSYIHASIEEEPLLPSSFWSGFFVSFDDPSFSLWRAMPPRKFRGGGGGQQRSRKASAQSKQPPLLQHPPPLPSSGAACSTHPRDLFWVCKWCVVLAPVVCVCTVQVEKQLKRRGESSTESGRTILFYYSSIILPYFSPFLSLSPPHVHVHVHSLSLSLSRWKLLLLGIHTTNARNLFFIDTVTRNRRTSFSEKRFHPKRVSPKIILRSLILP